MRHVIRGSGRLRPRCPCRCRGGANCVARRDVSPADARWPGAHFASRLAGSRTRRISRRLRRAIQRRLRLAGVRRGASALAGGGKGQGRGVATGVREPHPGSLRNRQERSPIRQHAAETRIAGETTVPPDCDQVKSRERKGRRCSCVPNHERIRPGRPYENPRAQRPSGGADL